MKHLKYAVKILAVAMFASCGDDHEPRGYIRALFNGEEWQARARAYTNMEVHGGGISISGKVYDRYGLESESILFTPYSKEIGLYPVLKKDYSKIQDSRYKTGWYVTIISGDALGDSFDVLESEINYLEITAVNNSEVKGNFQVTFVRDSTENRIDSPALPDTIRFTEGEFVVYVEELN